MTTLVPSLYYHNDWDIINETYKKFVEENRQKIDNLTEWIKKEPHLPQALDGASLGLFLNACNSSTENAKEMIDAYFTHKTRNPEMFADRSDYDQFNKMLDLVEVGVPDPWDFNLKGGRLSYVRLVDTDVSKLDFHMAMKTFTACLDFEIARVGLAITGVVAILDMSGFHLGYLPKLNMNDVAVVLKYVQIIECIVREVHVINCNALISQVMMLLRPFLSQNLASKLHFFTPQQMDQFYKAIPKSCIPSTYGGDLPSMEDLNADFRKRFQGSKDFLKLIDSGAYYVNDKLRREKTGKEEMLGSFRKLAID